MAWYDVVWPGAAPRPSSPRLAMAAFAPSTLSPPLPSLRLPQNRPLPQDVSSGSLRSLHQPKKNERAGGCGWGGWLASRFSLLASRFSLLAVRATVRRVADAPHAAALVPGVTEVMEVTGTTHVVMFEREECVTPGSSLRLVTTTESYSRSAVARGGSRPTRQSTTRAGPTCSAPTTSSSSRWVRS